MRRYTRLIFIISAVAACSSSIAQPVQEIDTKSAKEVLRRVEKNYHVRIKYDEKALKGLNVGYVNWSYASNGNKKPYTIFRPYDIVYTGLAKRSYAIRPMGDYKRSEAEGKKHLDELLAAYPNAAAFDKRKKELRECISTVLGISGKAKRTDLNPIIRKKVVMNGYTVENVAFESIPGYFVTGTLYRPTEGKGPFPVIINPHGHFYSEQDPSISKDSGRYRADMQYRCAAFAKMGAIAFDYDMYAWGESVLMTGDALAHETEFAGSIQTWNSIRAFDFLLSLPGADINRVGVTGASGGGTQTILVAALDDRVTLSAPVVMVSSSFNGGCPCESGLPIHGECTGHKTNNAEIAATIVPKPLLVVSDGDDWTKSVPGTDYPYLQKVFSFYGKESNVESVYLPNDKHDYGITKRVPVYKFFAKHFGLNLEAITGKDGTIDESGITIQQNKDQLVFDKDFPLPTRALRNHMDIKKVFTEIQQGK